MCIGEISSLPIALCGVQSRNIKRFHGDKRASGLERQRRNLIVEVLPEFADAVYIIADV
jgi:hypothetical protein